MAQNAATFPSEEYSILVSRLGGKPQEFLRHCGVESDGSQGEEIWIPYRQIADIYEYTAEQLCRPDFGMLLAAQSDLNRLGPLAVAMQNSNTVEEAQRLAAQYLYVVSAAVKFKVDVGRDKSRLELTFDLPNTPPASIPQAEDAALAFTHRQVRMLAGDNFQLFEVELHHPALCEERVYQEFFGAPVRLNAGRCSLTVATKTLKSPLRQASDTLRKMAMRYLAVQNPAHRRNFTDQVEIAIRRSMGTASCNRDAIAAALAVHPRTLQRRLEQEGQNFSDLLDGVRSKLARLYLSETDLPCAQISLMLGYSEQSIFSRRCRHWFNDTARAMRKSKRARTD